MRAFVITLAGAVGGAALAVAVILVMALGIMAMANRISWGWPIAAIVGIAIIFGAPQIVTWIRGMFGV